jgi:hypothetical protein
MDTTEREGEIERLREEVARLLAAALQADAAHEAETERAERRHNEAMATAQQVHGAQLANMEAALATRDLIGQAKGIIMASLSCSADDAFALLVKQSQAENRKVIDIAAGITAQVQRVRKPN